MLILFSVGNLKSCSAAKLCCSKDVHEVQPLFSWKTERKWCCALIPVLLQSEQFYHVVFSRNYTFYFVTVATTCRSELKYMNIRSSKQTWNLGCTPLYTRLFMLLQSMGGECGLIKENGRGFSAKVCALTGPATWLPIVELWLAWD